MDKGRCAYSGTCHCGAYRFQVELPDLNIQNIIKCNCVLCKKQGYLWQPLKAATFSVTRDEGKLVEYQSTTVKHKKLADMSKFCGNCGTGILGEHLEGSYQSDMVVNIRALLGINPFDFDKRDQVGSVDTENSVEHSTLPVTGSCACETVKVELFVPLSGLSLKEDNCSICARNAWTGAYLNKSQVQLSGRENVQKYSFGRKFMGHPFCKTCGVHVYMEVFGPPQHIVDQFSEPRKGFMRKQLELQPVNIRVLDSVDLNVLDVERSEEGTEGYEKDVLGLDNQK